MPHTTHPSFRTFSVWIMAASLLAFSACSTAPVIPTMTAVPTVLSVPPCAWQWASQPLPEIGAIVESALVAAGWKSTRVRAEAYGENCLTEGKVSRFAAMTTDFYLTVPVEPAVGNPELGGVAAAIYTDLLPVVSGMELPARPGYLDITFTMSGQEARTRLMFDEIQQQLDNGQALAEVLAP